MGLCTDNFDYPLDEALIAQAPSAKREDSRLMHLCRSQGSIEHRHFRDLPQLLRSGDLLVLNDTKVIPARFTARRRSGGRIDGLFLRELSLGRWEVLLRNAGKCCLDEAIVCDGPAEVKLALAENLGQGRWVVSMAQPAPAHQVLEAIGSAPLPPYIKPSAAQACSDRQRYQTVYATKAGAVAAPTAGLHFTPELLAELAGRGIERASVTLHVGMGTFLPVKTPDIAQHQMHSEWFELSEQSARQISRARAEGRRIVAVGTTSVRVLETAARQQADDGPTSQDKGQNMAATLKRRCRSLGGADACRPNPPIKDMRSSIQPSTGWTDIFIYPPAEFRVVDALVTNFHLPRSTLLMLISAFASPGDTEGVTTVLNAYRQATAMRYRFFSYGDAMLID